MKTIDYRLPRYAVQDAYIIEEMKSKYRHSTQTDRLSLLQKATNSGQIPYEVALLAVEDHDPVIRRWLAQNANELDFRERIWESNSDQSSNKTERYEFPDRNLWDILSEDTDELVRASLHENPHYPPYKYPEFLFNREQTLLSLNQLERLAFMRNPNWTSWMAVPTLLLKIFDLNDSSLNLDEKSRCSLALAFLSNTAAIEASQERYSDYDSIEQLWALLPKFPNGDVQSTAYRVLGGKDEWKAAAYKEIKFPDWRAAILFNATENDRKTQKLGIEDDNDLCRAIAAEKYSEPLHKPNIIWRVLGHVWTGITDIVILAVVLLLFSKVNSTFERLVIALLVYIHLTITSTSYGFVRIYQSSSIALDQQFRRLRELAKEELSPDERRIEKEQIQEVNEALSKANINFYIHASFQFLMWAVVVYNLLLILL